MDGLSCSEAAGYGKRSQGEWILNLDADEIVSKESTKEILRAVNTAEPDVHGFSMPRLSRYLNRWIKHGGWYPDRKVRLVRRGFGRWVGQGLHEKLEVSGKHRELEYPLLHYVYRDISDQLKTIDRFSASLLKTGADPLPEVCVWGLSTLSANSWNARSGNSAFWTEFPD